MAIKLTMDLPTESPFLEAPELKPNRIYLAYRKNPGPAQDAVYGVAVLAGADTVLYFTQGGWVSHDDARHPLGYTKFKEAPKGFVFSVTYGT